MKKNISMIIFFMVIFKITNFSQSFLEDDLYYWDFPLNGIGNYNVNYYSWVVSESFDNDWYLFSYDDHNWQRPVEANFTYYPPLVWSSDPLTSPSNSEIYIRGNISFENRDMGQIEKVKIMIISNDDYQLFFNEELIGEDLSGFTGPLNVYDITSFWNKNKRNLIAIKAINTLGSGWVQALVRVYLR